MRTQEHITNPVYEYVMQKPSRWMSTNPLTNFCMVSYAVPPERVRDYIPAGLDLDTRRDSRGDEKAFISAVIFKNDHIRLLPLPWPTFTFLQVNYRIYVRHKNTPGVWFFYLAQDSKMAGFNRRIFGTPTFYAHMRQDCDLDVQRGTSRYYRFDSDAPDHTLHLDVEPASDLTDFDGLFSSAEEMEVFLGSRPEGYFNNLRKPEITGISVWHNVIRPHFGTARRAEFSVLSDRGLVTGEEQRRPYSVMLTPRTVLLGQLPKRFVP